MKEWTKKEAEKTYSVSRWGEGYFDIDPSGDLVVKAVTKGAPIPIMEVVKEMRLQGVELPAVIRFHDILRAQVKKINKTFRDVIDEADYRGRFNGVYPIKVNQMREVVEEIIDAGEKYDYGLEAGSKPELLAVLAYNNNPNALTILNGYKDEEYLTLALMGTRLGRKIIFVLEKYSELPKLL
jgi:arginine decarboxylase